MLPAEAASNSVGLDLRDATTLVAEERGHVLRIGHGSGGLVSAFSSAKIYGSAGSVTEISSMSPAESASHSTVDWSGSATSLRR